ncbi:DUF29 domain-containing protein, partial [Endozoicomonas sp. ONNA1]|uniref:DUF29 domain-containing protein n=1 Tax=Endozoicomonas sp. ONNA1 TaxID=2828740 RepID=UPI002148E65E
MKTLYEEDYYGWLNQQADLLANHDLKQLDIENLINELSNRIIQVTGELETLLTKLLCYLLGCDYQTRVIKNVHQIEEFKQWVYNINLHRKAIKKQLSDNISLTDYKEKAIIESYQQAKKHSIRLVSSYNRNNRTKGRIAPITDDSFPIECPW